MQNFCALIGTRMLNYFRHNKRSPSTILLFLPALTLELLYEQDLNVTSLGTISDVKSHQASATMSSISEMFRFSDLTNTNKLFILSDSPTSQYRNRKMIFLMKVWATKNHIDVYWIYTESGYGKGPTDGVGAGIKQTFKDTIAYDPKRVITNTDEVMQYMPEMPSVRISTYKEEEVNQFKSLYPKILDKLKIISSGGFGISQVREIYIPASDKTTLEWKKMSSDTKYSKAQIVVTPMPGKVRNRKKKPRK